MQQAHAKHSDTTADSSVLFRPNLVKVNSLNVFQLQHVTKIATIWTTSYSKTDMHMHVITVSMWRHILLSLWSFGHISYTDVITRLQVAELPRTSTTIFVSCVQQAQYKQQRFTWCSGR